MILPSSEGHWGPFGQFLKGFANVQSLNSCHRLDKAHLACASTHGHLWRSCLCLNLLECHPKRCTGALGARLMEPHSWALSPCLTRCRDHVVDTQIDVHKHRAIMVTTFSIMLVILHIHSLPWLGLGLDNNRPGYTIGVKIVSSVNFGVVRLSWLMKMAILRRQWPWVLPYRTCPNNLYCSFAEYHKLSDINSSRAMTATLSWNQIHHTRNVVRHCKTRFIKTRCGVLRWCFFSLVTKWCRLYHNES